MPDSSPSTKLLRKLGLNIPDEAPALVREEQNRIALEEQSKLPIWKQYAQTGVDALMGGLKGIIGIDPAEDESYAGRKSNLGMQALQSGLPFATLRAGKPIYHGTRRIYEKFNPDVYDTSDVLGWMTHGAVDPDYADAYAMGNMKGTDWEGKNYRPNIIAMQPEAKNVLDLVDPNADDMSQVLAAVDPRTRKHMIQLFKASRRDPGDARAWLKGLHYPKPEQIPDNEVAIRRLADILRLSPEEFDKTPFDAIRYRDIAQESYAIPAKTPIRAAYSKAPLNDPPKELKVIKSDEPRGGMLKISEDRWKRTPLSLKDQPEPEIYKNYTPIGDKPKEPKPALASNSYINSSWNSMYTTKEGEHLIELAEKAGIDWNKYENYHKLAEELDPALAKTKVYSK